MYEMGVASARQVTAARRVLMQWITCPVVHFELMLCTRYPMSSSMIDCESSLYISALVESESNNGSLPRSASGEMLGCCIILSPS